MKTNDIWWWRKMREGRFANFCFTEKTENYTQQENKVITEKMTSEIDIYRKQKINQFSIMKDYSKTWGYRKLLFYKGGRRWGNQTRMQFELAISYKTFFSLSYFILRVITVRQEVIENVDSFESKWKWLKYFFQSFNMKDYKVKTL